MIAAEIAVEAGHRLLVDVGDVNGDRLVVGEAAVGGAHLHQIAVVVIGVGRVLEVRRIDEGQRAARGIDLERRLIGAADDRVGERRAESTSVACTVVTAVIFSATEKAGRVAAAIGGDDRRIIDGGDVDDRGIAAGQRHA